jgi:hypothetical protein
MGKLGVDGVWGVVENKFVEILVELIKDGWYNMLKVKLFLTMMSV